MSLSPSSLAEKMIYPPPSPPPPPPRSRLLSTFLAALRSIFSCTTLTDDDDSIPSAHPYTPTSSSPPRVFPEWTPSELETLMHRWTQTHPGPATHPQNAGITSLMTLIDSGSGTASDTATLHASLLFRLKMDHHIEVLAHDLGLSWHGLGRAPSHASRYSATSEFSAFSGSVATFSPGVLGIEEFEPPPARALTREARGILLNCCGEWKEAVMPLPREGVKQRYRKPKYWIVSVAAVNGVSASDLDARMEEWFRKNGDRGLFE